RRSKRHASATVRGEGAAERAQRSDRPDRRHGVWTVWRLRWAHPHADGGAARGRGAALQRVPHYSALLADPLGPAERPQPSREQLRFDRRDRDGIPRPNRPAPEERRTTGRNAAAERLK